jgi:hypothetical protein
MGKKKEKINQITHFQNLNFLYDISLKEILVKCGYSKISFQIGTPEYTNMQIFINRAKEGGEEEKQDLFRFSTILLASVRLIFYPDYAKITLDYIKNLSS